jgi:hypothetical protein
MTTTKALLKLLATENTARLARKANERLALAFGYRDDVELAEGKVVVTRELDGTIKYHATFPVKGPRPGDSGVVVHVKDNGVALRASFEASRSFRRFSHAEALEEVLGKSS